MTDTPETDTPDRLAALRRAGLPVDDLSAEQQVVLGELSGEELTLLLTIRARLDELEPEVQAHTHVAGAGLF